MADNVTVNTITGSPVVATDDDGTGHVQWVKLKFGANGVFTAVESGVGLPVEMVSVIAGEDVAQDVLKVEQRFGYVNITLAAPTTTVVKSGPGFLHFITINKATALGVITVYDNTAGSGTLIATITQPAALLGSQIVLPYDVAFLVGLTIVTSGAAQDITVSAR